MGVGRAPEIEMMIAIADKSEKIVGELIEKTSIAIEKSRLEKRRENRRIVAFRYAKRHDVHPIPELDAQVKHILYRRILAEAKKLDLYHAELSTICNVCRPKITNILNGKLKNITIDLLIKILCRLGIEPEVTFKK